MYLNFIGMNCKVQTKSVSWRTICKLMNRNVEMLRTETVAFTGHRHYDGRCDDLLCAVVRDLYGRGFRRFWSGMAAGFDLAAAETIVSMRGGMPGMRLCCAVPFIGQAARFHAAERLRYDKVLAAADETVILSERYTQHCYLRRDEFMVDQAAVLVAWYDGTPGGTHYTWEYARRQGIERINLWRDPQGALF